MKVKHVFGGNYYVISNYGTARNPIFKNDADVQNFSEKMSEYLGEICEIHAYNHQINQFHYLIKVHERPVLESFFYEKKAKKKGKGKNIAHDIYDLKSETPPDSYLIFSQEVSNCLNSYVKSFNYIHSRRGGLFAGRYQKHLIESEEEYQEWVERLNNMEEIIVFEEEWQVPDTVELDNSAGECSSKLYYEEASEEEVGHKVLTNFVKLNFHKLRGCFLTLPPKSIHAPNFSQKFNHYLKIHGTHPPW